MKDASREGAAKGAAASLEALERWAKLTFAAALITAVMASAMACTAGYAAWEYVRFKTAVYDASERFVNGPTEVADTTP